MEDFVDEFGLVGDKDKVKGTIEAILFAAGNAISIKDIAFASGISEKNTKGILSEMIDDYDKSSRGICIIEFNDKYQLCTKPQYGECIKRLVKDDTKQNLSQAALETLSIIAYKQPITKVEVDDIRGVRSDRAVSTLLECGLIKENGRLEAPGKPIIYVTTDNFLKYFGFKKLEELPQLIEFNIENGKE